MIQDQEFKGSDSLNHFIRIGVGFVILVGLLLATGLIITKAMPDGTEQFSGVAAAAARNALQHAYGFYDNPIKRGAYIQKYKVVSVQIKGPPPKVPTPPPRDDSEPRPALEANLVGGVFATDETGALLPVYEARVRTYTLFSIPADTILIDTVDGSRRLLGSPPLRSGVYEKSRKSMESRGQTR